MKLSENKITMRKQQRRFKNIPPKYLLCLVFYKKKAYDWAISLQLFQNLLYF